MPTEFRVGEHLYRTRQKLNARQQFHVARRMAPLIGQFVALGPMLNAALSAETMDQATIEALILSLSGALSRMEDAECDYVLDHCLGVVQRSSGNGGGPVWSDIWNARANALQFQDIELPAMLQITAEVLQENLSSFFATGLPAAIARNTEQAQPPQQASIG